MHWSIIHHIELCFFSMVMHISYMIHDYFIAMLPKCIAYFLVLAHILPIWCHYIEFGYHPPYTHGWLLELKTLLVGASSYWGTRTYCLASYFNTMLCFYLLYFWGWAWHIPKAPSYLRLRVSWIHSYDCIVMT